MVELCVYVVNLYGKPLNKSGSLGPESSSLHVVHDIIAKPVLTYGPWHDRVRASLLLHFMPFDFQDQPIYYAPAKGQLRSAVAFHVNGTYRSEDACWLCTSLVLVYRPAHRSQQEHATVFQWFSDRSFDVVCACASTAEHDQ